MKPCFFRTERSQFAALPPHMAILAASLVAAVAATAPAAVRRPMAAPPRFPASEQIAFMSDRSHVPDVYAMNDRGGGVRALTHNRAESGSVDVAVDGRYVFMSGPENDRTIWIAAPDGSHRRRIATGENPSWSPDGRTVAYGRINQANVNDRRNGVYTVDADGTRIRQIATTKGATEAPTATWAPDGTMLAFTTETGIDTVTIATRKRHELVPVADTFAGPAWSPDGAWVAYYDESQTDVFVVAAAGGTPRRITHTPDTQEDGVSWRPDGALTFMTLPDSTHIATAINPDGSGRRVLFTVGLRLSPMFPRLSWTHDGRDAIVSDSLGVGQVLRLDANGGHRHTILPGITAQTPRWSPNGRRLAFATATGIGVIGAGATTYDLPAPCPQLSWSPDGKRIVCGTDNIFELLLAPRLRRRGLLFDNGIGDSTKADPDFAPDGKRFAYVEPDFGGIAIYDFARGQQARQPAIPIKTKWALAPDVPAWSPDGIRISFASDCSNQARCTPGVFVVDVDGRHLRRVSPDGDNPDWSPDGTRIAFDATHRSNRDIYVVDADGTNRRRLTRDPAADSDPTWRRS